MFTVAVTGSICSGKTTFCTYFCKQYQCGYISADAIVHRLQRKGTVCFKEIVAVFGKGFVTASGQLDRKNLRAHIFSHPRARRMLNRIVHPKVIRAIKKNIGGLERQGIKVVVAEIPLLFETKSDRLFDMSVSVSVSPATQLKRIQQKYAVAATEARKRIKAQLSQELKNRKADVVICAENKTLLKREAQRLWQKIRERIK